MPRLAQMTQPWNWSSASDHETAAVSNHKGARLPRLGLERHPATTRDVARLTATASNGTPPGGASGPVAPAGSPRTSPGGVEKYWNRRAEDAAVRARRRVRHDGQLLAVLGRCGREAERVDVAVAGLGLEPARGVVLPDALELFVAVVHEAEVVPELVRQRQPAE